MAVIGRREQQAGYFEENKLEREKNYLRSGQEEPDSPSFVKLEQLF